MPRNLLLSVLLTGVSMHSVAAPAAADANGALAAFHAALARGDKAGVLELLAPKVAIYESGYVAASRDVYQNHHFSRDIAFERTSTRKVLRHSEKWQEIPQSFGTKRKQ